MKKFRILALLTVLCVIGSVFAADWSFVEATGTAEKDANPTASIAEAETVDISGIGSWAVTSNTLAVAYSNPDANKEGYEVKADVTGSIVYTFTIDSPTYSVELVDVMTATAKMGTYSIDAGNVKATAAFDASKVTVEKNNTAGTITVTVPATAVTVTCTGAFTKEADYNAFKTAVLATNLVLTAVATATPAA